MARELTLTFSEQLVIFTWFRRIIMNYDAISNKCDMIRWNKGFPCFLESQKALEVASRLMIIVPKFKQVISFRNYEGTYHFLIDSRRSLLSTYLYLTEIKWFTSSLEKYSHNHKPQHRIAISCKKKCSRIFSYLKSTPVIPSNRALMESLDKNISLT